MLFDLLVECHCSSLVRPRGWRFLIFVVPEEGGHPQVPE